MTSVHCKCVLHINYICMFFDKIKVKFTTKNLKNDLSALKEFFFHIKSLASNKKIWLLNFRWI